MNWKRYAIFVLAVVYAMVCLSGCSKSKQPTESQTTTTGTIPALLNIDITTLLTSEQVSKAVGVTVGNAQSQDSGTTAHYASADEKSSADISMKECDRSIFDSTVGQYSDAVDTPNIGDAAKWSPEAKQLLVYGKGYMISVMVDVDNKNNDALLLAARQLAVLVLDKLP